MPITKLTEKDLIDFEDQVVEAFRNKKIRAPVHLYSGNEQEMLKVFEDIKVEDWVFCSWRSHYQALLKGVPRELLMEEILKGHSISLNFLEYRFVSSAIVTGTLPIAVGTALAIKKRGSKERVHCFIGDMTAETGAAHECIKYSLANQLPIRFIIEDNGHSVCTETLKTWGLDNPTYQTKGDSIYYYKYKSKYPHAGVGERIMF